MTHNGYPGAHEDDANQSPEVAFNSVFGSLMDDPQPEMEGLQVMQGGYPTNGRVISARTPDGKYSLVVFTGHNFNRTTMLHDPVIKVEASSDRPLVSVQYKMALGSPSGTGVTAMPLKVGGELSEGEAGFLADVGLGEVALRADTVEQSAQSGTAGLRHEYFPNAAELSTLPGMPSTVAAYQG